MRGTVVGCPIREQRDPQNHSHSQKSFVGDFGTRGRVPTKEVGISQRALKVLQNYPAAPTKEKRRPESWRFLFPPPQGN
jgi:hypothetical protein